MKGVRMNGHGIIRATLAFVAITVAGCGIDNSPDVEYRRPAQPDTAFDSVKSVVDAKCAKCHNGSTHPLNFDAPGVFKASKAAARIKAGTMPPTGPLDDASKVTLLGYLEG